MILRKSLLGHLTLIEMVLCNMKNFQSFTFTLVTIFFLRKHITSLIELWILQDRWRFWCHGSGGLSCIFSRNGNLIFNLGIDCWLSVIQLCFLVRNVTIHLKKPYFLFHWAVSWYLMHKALLHNATKTIKDTFCTNCCQQFCWTISFSSSCICTCRCFLTSFWQY